MGIVQLKVDTTPAFLYNYRSKNYLCLIIFNFGWYIFGQVHPKLLFRRRCNCISCDDHLAYGTGVSTTLNVEFRVIWNGMLEIGTPRVPVI